MRAKALYETGRLAYVQGDLLVSRRLLNESISIYRELGTSCQFELALGLLMLGDTETGMGNYTAASSLIMEGMEIMRALEDLRGIARAFWKLGWCMGRLGEYEQASQYFTEALSIYRQFENKDGLSMVLSGLGEVALRQSDYERAIALLEESLALRRTTGDKWGIAASMGTLAWVAMRRVYLSQAKTLLFESLTIRRDLEQRGGTAWCMEKLAEIAVTKGQWGYTHQREPTLPTCRVGRWGCKVLPGTSNSVIDLVDQPEYERLVAHLQSQLDETAYPMPGLRVRI